MMMMMTVRATSMARRCLEVVIVGVSRLGIAARVRRVALRSFHGRIPIIVANALVARSRTALTGSVCVVAEIPPVVRVVPTTTVVRCACVRSNVALRSRFFREIR